MSMKESENVDGEDERCVKIDTDSKKTNGWKTLKELKEYLRSEFEKKAESWERERYEGETFLHFAACLGDVDAMKMLIEDSAEVNASDEIERTALHWAAEQGHVDVAKVLIQNGADVNAVDHFKATALHFAIKNYYKDIALRLLCFGADLDMVKSTHNFLRPITDRLNLLDGKRMMPLRTSLMSNEERRFMWNVAFSLATKEDFGDLDAIIYKKIRLFITFRGIFMASGYDRGEKSVWRAGAIGLVFENI